MSRVKSGPVFRVTRALALASLACLSLQADTIKVGQTFPSLDLLRPAAPATTPAATVTLVDFWASWCAPCQASFPALGKIQQEFAERGFVIFAVSQDDSEAPYAAFLKKFHPPFATARDAKHTLATQVNVPAMPTSYLLDRSGRVRFVHEGFHGDATVRELRQEIEQLLAEK